jgi:hypothetical protein
LERPRHMKRLLGSALVAVALAMGAPAVRAQPLGDLIQKLSQGTDFRVRVQAALQIGKTKGRTSRLALEAALDDENAAVRAAAAAGLRVMGDLAAIPALERHETDGSPAVRAQIKTSTDALRLGGGSGESAEKTELVVQLGKIRSGASTTTGAVLEAAARTSRQRLRELPGIAVFDEGKEPTGARRALPIVMVTGRVKQLEQSREGTSVIYLASIEFVLHKMPGQTIKGVVSGSARASGSVEEMNTIGALADLQRSALEAAIDSAVRRAPQALRAAAQ